MHSTLADASPDSARTVSIPAAPSIAGSRNRTTRPSIALSATRPGVSPVSGITAPGLQIGQIDSGKPCSGHQSPLAWNTAVSAGLHWVQRAWGKPCSQDPSSVGTGSARASWASTRSFDSLAPRGVSPQPHEARRTTPMTTRALMGSPRAGAERCAARGCRSGTATRAGRAPRTNPPWP